MLEVRSLTQLAFDVMSSLAQRSSLWQIHDADLCGQNSTHAPNGIPFQLTRAQQYPYTFAAPV